jgi:hypothetical protein
MTLLEKFGEWEEKESQPCGCSVFIILEDADTNGRWLYCKEHDQKIYQSYSDLAALRKEK